MKVDTQLEIARNDDMGRCHHLAQGWHKVAVTVLHRVAWCLTGLIDAVNCRGGQGARPVAWLHRKADSRRAVARYRLKAGPGFAAVAARKVGLVRFFGEINPLPSFFQARCIG
jgi:hypothetical protein